MLWQENIHPGMSPPLFGTDYGGLARNLRVQVYRQTAGNCGAQSHGTKVRLIPGGCITFAGLQIWQTIGNDGTQSQALSCRESGAMHDRLH